MGFDSMVSLSLSWLLHFVSLYILNLNVSSVLPLLANWTTFITSVMGPKAWPSSIIRCANLDLLFAYL